MTLIISTISLGVVVPTLKGRKADADEYRPNYFACRRDCGFVTMILLAVFASIYGDENRRICGC